MYSINKSGLHGSHPALNFAEIQQAISNRKSQIEAFSELYFNRQILLSDADAYRTDQIEVPDTAKSGYSVKKTILSLASPNSILDNAGEFSYSPDLAQPRSIMNSGLFSIDGSVMLDSKAFASSSPPFFCRSRRATEFRDKIHLRGARYTISANPTYELRQKLATYREDYEEGLLALEGKLDYVYRLGIADYVKNSVLTMLNSFLYEEKIGHYYLERPAYQSLRRESQILAQASVELFYGTMGRIKTMTERSHKYLIEHSETFRKLQAHILQEYKNGVFSSRHMTRPEASHPLVNAGAALGSAWFNKPPQLIVGLPAGSTELSLLQSTAYQLVQRANIQVLLVPVSLHSIKHDFDGKNFTSANSIQRFLRTGKVNLKGKRVLIVDDNSSTGRTIQLVADSLRAVGARPMKHPAIAEADVIRSKLDRNSSTRTKIADRSCYNFAVSVLPVSKRIYPKADLRQLSESRKMVKCINERYLNPSANLQRKIVGRVYIDLINNPTEKFIEGLAPNEQIDSFRKTFLSNFHEVPIRYLGKDYLSVEHAYQAMKFTEHGLASVTQNHLDIINKNLAPRGVAVTTEDLPNLFIDPAFNAGSSKIAANQLRILGYVRADWDDVKADIMCQLLIQKFSYSGLYKMLRDTGDKYLIEGNDWGDTYWGVCGKRGRNVLGRMLMQIRNLDRKILVSEAIVDKEELVDGSGK
ncbi:NADAR domain-containing protein [Sulfitobacter dubius]|uniref:NADAR domain-containing protein n=1 Tax=Sulfitobacter dubius TaxID=218673 RepID=UPI0022B02B9D|nr:NADAR domain-containing protein [Sulfitobacter dubius]MCZ4367458.1 NADAR domain-containing protein [Sulfitobacter dubius]